MNVLATIFEIENEYIFAIRSDAMRCDAMRCDAMRCDAIRCNHYNYVHNIIICQTTVDPIRIKRIKRISIAKCFN